MTYRDRGMGGGVGRLVGSGAGMLLALFSAGELTAQQQAAPPNIVLIMADDLGFSDIGAYGGEVRTPNLDSLASGGLRFTQFYNTARCSPSRASLMTGLHPHQAGMGDMPDAYAARVRGIFNSPAYTDHLSYTTPTIAEVLRTAGYATFMSGKWHLGYHRPQWPVDRGFDRSFSVLEGAMNYYGYGIQHTGTTSDPPMVMDSEVYTPPREGFFATDEWTSSAVRFIREHQGTQPFFLYLSHTAPHWPLQAPAEDIARYRGSYAAKGWDRLREERYTRLVEKGLFESAWTLAPRPVNVPAWEALPEADRDRWDLEMSIYAAQIERMDSGIGAVMQALRDRGLAENTMVVFLSDNGGAAEDPNRSLPGSQPGTRDWYEGYGIRGAHLSSAPFRLTKKWMHEGGIASPLIIHWPAGGLERGGIRHQPAQIIDLLPTFLDISATHFPLRFGGALTLAPEGVSIRPAFTGDPLRDRVLYWEHEGNRAVRQGRWKLVRQYPGEWELYDVAADRTELNNLAAREPGRSRTMAALWDAWAARVGAQPWELVDPNRVQN